MTTQTPQPHNQIFAYIATSREPPIKDFEQWARLVRIQMVTSLKRSSKHYFK